MKEPAGHFDKIRDAARLEVLEQTGLLYSPQSEALQRLTRLAHKLLGADVTFITAVEPERQHILSSSAEGWPPHTPLDRSICQYVVSSEDNLIVPDTREHPLLYDNPAVVEDEIIAYAGVPLRMPPGFVMGSFCAAAHRPHDWTAEQVAILEDLAAAASTEIELRLDNMIRKRMEQELAEAYHAAEAANVAKSDFLANMSHELRTPLNSVIGFTNMLLKNRSGRLQNDELQYLDRVRANGLHLLSLINEVLDLAKVEAGRLEISLEEVDLGTMVEQTAEELQGKKREGVTLTTRVPAPLTPITADPMRLKQVIINLTGNALKFTEQGSVEVRVLAGADGTPLALEVQDTGIGIPAHRVAAIFEPFSQADADTQRKFGGTGLGLAISRALCEMMGFRLQVESEEGVGSTFRILFGSTDT